MSRQKEKKRKYISPLSRFFHRLALVVVTLAVLNAIDTSNVERMVHVMPIMTVVREDIEKKLFTRDELQKGAPEVMDGYWQVPRVVE